MIDVIERNVIELLLKNFQPNQLQLFSKNAARHRHLPRK
jgi:hypothetical protein